MLIVAYPYLKIPINCHSDSYMNILASAQQISIGGINFLCTVQYKESNFYSIKMES